MLQFGGSLVCVGMPEGEQVPIATAFPTFMVKGQYKILGSAVGNRQEAIETLEMARRGVIKIPTRTVGMGELQSIFEEMGQGRITGRVVLDMSI